MATEANSVTLSTNFNVAPYYDDFDETKNYHRVLFRPGLAVQARELTQMQSILQNQIDRFAEHIFKEGSVVRGLELNFDPRYNYVRIRDRNVSDASVNAAAFLNKTIKGSTSGVRALVINSNEGSEANTPNFKTLFVKYLAANTSTGRKYFTNNEIITTTDGSGLSCNTIVGTVPVPAEGYGTAVVYNSGIVFAKDHFIRVPKQTVILSKYSSTPSVRVGFNVEEDIVTEATDTTLLDPAQGSYNYAAPGAARLKLTANLISVPLTSTVSNTFIELLQVENGIVQSISNRTQYSQIRDYMAQRTYDESGDYVVNGLGVNIKESLKSGNNQGVYTLAEGGEANSLIVFVEPGKAYVKGYDSEFIVSRPVTIDKGIDYASVESAKALTQYGNYVYVDNVVGQWDVDGQDIVSLRSDQANAVSQLGYSLTTFPGAEIGTARVRGIEYNSGTPGLPSSQYRLYISNINMNAGYSFANVQSITFNGGVGAANGKADIVSSTGYNANTYDSSFNRAIFRLPAKAIRQLRNTSDAVNNDFNFYKSFDVTFDTSGVATINTGDTSETFDGSGALSDAAIRSDFYVVSRQAANTATLTGTISVTSGSNTVTGSGTAFDTQINPGDIIHVSNNTDYVVSAVNSATSLNILSNATASRTGVDYFKRFKSGQVIDLGGVGRDGARGITISGTPSTTATLDMNETLNTVGGMPARIIVQLNKIDGQEAAKTVIRDRLVQINVGNGGGTSYVANTTGPWSLGLSDGFKLLSVRKKSGSNFASTTEGTDVTSQFTLDSGQTDNYYDHAKLVLKPTSTLSITNNDRLLVTLDHFTHSYSSGVGYFSVDSYPVDDVNAGTDTTKIYTYEIPVYTSKTTGSTFDLRDCIDMRPRIQDSANSVSTLTNVSINPLTSTTVVEPAGGLHFSPSNQDFTTDLDYYLPRKDLIVLSRDGKVSSIRGLPSQKAVTPIPSETVMPLASVLVAPYPSLPFENARRVNRLDLANVIKKIKNKRYTMKDIGKIDERIDRLEYYTALTLTETDTKNLTILDENGLDRFKNGILVDSFTGHGIGNVHDIDYKISIDSKKGEMRPLFSVDNTPLVYSSSSSNVVRTNVTVGGVSRDQKLVVTVSSGTFVVGETVTSSGQTATIRNIAGSGTILYVEDATGNFAASASISGGTSSTLGTISSVSTTTPGDLVTLPYSHKVLVRQPYATTTRNAAGTYYNWKGVLTLSPDSDYWMDTTSRPDVNINIDLNTDAWLWLSNSWQTNWNGWETTFTGEPTLTDTNITTFTSTSTLGSSRSWDEWNNPLLTTTFEDTQTTITEQIFTTPLIETRTGAKDTVNIVTDTQSYGSFVRDVNIIPFMRSQMIMCKMDGMKPSSRLYAFFDSISVSDYVTPLTASEYNNQLKDTNGSPVVPTATEGDALYSNTDGTAYCVFRIPNDTSLQFRTGTKRLRFVDNAQNSSTFGTFTTSAEASYTSEGLTAGVSDLTVATKKPTISQTTLTETREGSITTSSSTTERTVGLRTETEPTDDPIAQTMLVVGKLKANVNTSGIYLTKIDLFFSSKDSSLPITIELREVDKLTGYITPVVVPFSKVVLQASDVNISSDGSAATPVYFPSPVYLTESHEYAVVLMPAAVNPNYNAFVAVLGETDLITGARVSQQPASGYLFASSNDRTWVPVENEDLKFTAYYAEFDKSSTGNLVVKNPNRDTFTITDQSGGFLNKVGEVVHGETLLVGTFAPGDGLTGNVASSNSFVQGMTSGATGVITSLSTTQIKVKNVSTSAKFAGGEAVRFRLGESATTSPVAGNSSGGITSATTPTGRVYLYDAVNYANTKLYVSNTSYSNSGTACTANRMFTQDMYITGQTNGYSAKIASIDNLIVDDINLQTNMILPSNTNILGYMKMATSTSTRDSTYTRINVNRNTELNSPRYIISRSNESNTSATSATMAANRSLEIKYEFDCRNIVASPAIDLRRISVVSTHNLISSNTEIGSSEDLVKFGGNSKTRYISRKVVLADGQDAEDLRVYVTAYKPPGSEVHLYCKLLNGEDSDDFTDAKWLPMVRNVTEGFTNAARYSSTENRNDFIEYVYDVPAFNDTSRIGANTANQGVVEYRNTSGATMIGFKYFAIKVVLTNSTSTNPPRLADLRAIALQR